jgi:hypothetical protein
MQSRKHQPEMPTAVLSRTVRDRFNDYWKIGLPMLVWFAVVAIP